MTTKPKHIKCKNNYGEEVKVLSEKFFFRPSAYGFIVQDGMVVVMRNKSNGKLWFPGGGIEIHERLEEGLKREIKEETGLKVDVNDLAFFKENYFYYQPLDEAYHAFLFFYLCQPKSRDLLRDELVDDLESQKPRWMKISDIQKKDIGDLSAEIYKYLQNLLVD